MEKQEKCGMYRKKKRRSRNNGKIVKIMGKKMGKRENGKVEKMKIWRIKRGKTYFNIDESLCFGEVQASYHL